MGDDLVTRLRSNLVSQTYQREAADCIEWLRSQLRGADTLPSRLREIERDLFKEGPRIRNSYHLDVIGEAADEIERLREVISRMEVRRG